VSAYSCKNYDRPAYQADALQSHESWVLGNWGLRRIGKMPKAFPPVAGFAFWAIFA
jgi:hypothetical protein